MSNETAWLALITGDVAVAAKAASDDPRQSGWLPNESVARAWMQYVVDTAVTDDTPPPAPTGVQVNDRELTWVVEADLESGLAQVVIERNGREIGRVPDLSKNPFGRPVYQNLQYSDTPVQPLQPNRFTDTLAAPNQRYTYRLWSVNTAGLPSQPVAVQLEAAR
jgi:hypothetical protein